MTTTHGPGHPPAASPATPGLTARWERALANTYGTPPIELVSGRGAQLRAADGTEYVDLLGGIAVNALGHGHPAIVDAVTRQLNSLGHVSNLYLAEPPIALAEKLLDILSSTTPAEVFFCNSGTEANEAAFKVARLTGRSRILAMEGGFHGRTMGALALTGQPAKREPFAPLPAGVEFVPYGDAAALSGAIDLDPAAVAAVIVEPIQGEAGVQVPPPGYLTEVRALTAAAGALMIVDEVQTGIGRTGHWFLSRSQGVEPDIITLAKGLGGGLPIGAALLSGKAYGLLRPGQHGTTFGGNPVVCAAALAVLETIEDTRLLGEVARKGKALGAAIEGLDHALIDHVRGEGLLLGVGLSQPVAAAVERSARAHGFLLNAPRPDTVRLAPPLIITDEQLTYFVSALPSILDDALKGAES